MKDALDSLNAALRERLTGESVWDTRLYPDAAPPRAVRPLLVYNTVVGGDSNRLHHRAPGFSIDVKCIAAGDDDPYSQAMAGAAAITELLDNQGIQDKDENGNPGVVIGDADWLIKTITQGARIHIPDDQEIIGEIVYYSGHTFRIEMEVIR